MWAFKFVDYMRMCDAFRLHVKFVVDLGFSDFFQIEVSLRLESRYSTQHCQGKCFFYYTLLFVNFGHIAQNEIV